MQQESVKLHHTREIAFQDKWQGNRSFYPIERLYVRTYNRCVANAERARFALGCVYAIDNLRAQFVCLAKRVQYDFN